MGEGTAKLGEVQEGFGEYLSSCGVAQNKFCCLRPKGGTPAFQRPGAGGKRPQGGERAEVGTPPSPPLGQASSSFQLRALFPTGSDLRTPGLGWRLCGRPPGEDLRRKTKPSLVAATPLRRTGMGSAPVDAGYSLFQLFPCDLPR